MKTDLFRVNSVFSAPLDKVRCMPLVGVIFIVKGCMLLIMGA
jgi:hypothetical protein